MYNTLSELIKNLTGSPYIKIEDWVYTNNNGKLSFTYKGDLIATYCCDKLVLYREGIEKHFMERDLLMKRFADATSSKDFVYYSPKGDEVFIGYSDGDFVVTLYGENVRIIVLPNGDYLKVYADNAYRILEQLQRYNVEKSSDAPNANYACMIKVCPKCGIPFLIKHKVAHMRRELCWHCQPQSLGGKT